MGLGRGRREGRQGERRTEVNEVGGGGKRRGGKEEDKEEKREMKSGEELNFVQYMCEQCVPGTPTDLSSTWEQGYTLSFSPTLCSWLHNPGTGRVSAELLHKNVVVSWQHEGHGDEI